MRAMGITCSRSGPWRGPLPIRGVARDAVNARPSRSTERIAPRRPENIIDPARAAPWCPRTPLRGAKPARLGGMFDAGAPNRPHFSPGEKNLPAKPQLTGVTGRPVAPAASNMPPNRTRFPPEAAPRKARRPADTQSHALPARGGAPTLPRPSRHTTRAARPSRPATSGAASELGRRTGGPSGTYEASATYSLSPAVACVALMAESASLASRHFQSVKAGWS